jgi:hypothetical protein
LQEVTAAAVEVCYLDTSATKLAHIMLPLLAALLLQNSCLAEIMTLDAVQSPSNMLRLQVSHNAQGVLSAAAASDGVLYLLPGWAKNREVQECQVVVRYSDC